MKTAAIVIVGLGVVGGGFLIWRNYQVKQAEAEALAATEQVIAIADEAVSGASSSSDKSWLGQIPVVGGLFDAVGL